MKNEAMNFVCDVQVLLSSLDYLNAELDELAFRPHDNDKYDAVQMARQATSEKLNKLVQNFQYYLKYGVKDEEAEQ